MARKLPEYLTPELALDYAQEIGDALGADWNKVSLADFARGLAIELEHASRDHENDITDDRYVSNTLLIGKVALNHLYEAADYYTRFDTMEHDK